MTFNPYSMREIADRVENLIKEAEGIGNTDDKESGEKKSLDDLLTTDAGAEKLVGQIDKNKLLSKLQLQGTEGEDLYKAIQNLGKESPVINAENATAIVKAFFKIAPKAELKEASHWLDFNLLETYNKNFDNPIGFRDVEKALKAASEASPLAKNIALKLAVTLTKGSKNRRLDEGLEGVFNAVVFAIKIAREKNRSELLHMLDDFETKYESDNYAFDQEHFFDLVKNLKALAKEVMAHTKE